MYQPQPGQQQMQQQQNPQQQQQRKDQQQQQQQFMSAEAQAREKLSHYVYEYLVHMGAVKSADVFKSEVLAQNGNGGLQVDSLSSPPGFLFNWFSVFWDLYSAHPDKKEKAEASNDAKAYHKMMMPGCGFPEGLVNGGIYGPPGFPNAGMGPLGAPPPQNLPDGMFPGGFYNGPRAGGGPPPSQSSQASPIPGGPRYSQQGTRSGAPTPVGIGNNNFPAGHTQPPPQMNALGMNEQQMRLAMIQHQQRQAQAAAAAAATQQGRLHMNLPPAGGPQGKQIRAQFGGPAPGQYMDSPTGTPPFASNPLGHNGTAGGQSLMSPGASAAPGSQQGVPGVSAGGPMPGGEVGPGSQESAARFMMIGAGGGGGGMAQQQFMNHHDAPGANTTRTPGPGSVSAGGMNPNGGAGSMGGGAEGENGNNGNSSGGAAGSSQLHSLLNGTADMQLEMKQSPAFSGGQMGGVGVGTPISASSAGAGPGSVHSQSGGGGNNSQQHSQQQQQQTPISEAMDIGGHLGSHQSDEISKIKASLMEGYSNSRDYD